MKKINKKSGNNISLLVASLSIGWMVGLSISPVVGIIISGITTISVSAVSILSGLKYQAEEDDGKKEYIKNISSLDVFPVAILCVGLAIGSALGIYTRTHKLFDDHSVFVKIRNKSKNNPCVPKGNQVDEKEGTVLYSLTVEECQLMEQKHGKELRALLKTLGDKNVQFLAKSCSNDSCLEALKNMFCNIKGRPNDSSLRH